MVTKLNITSPKVIEEAIVITGPSPLPFLKELPGTAGVPGAYEMVIVAGQRAYAEAYEYVYYISIAFGGVSIIAVCFLGDISPYGRSCRGISLLFQELSGYVRSVASSVNSIQDMSSFFLQQDIELAVRKSDAFSDHTIN